MALNPNELLWSPQVWQPADVERAWELKQLYGERAQFVAGGTLLRTQWESGLGRMPEHLVSLEHIAAMHGVRAVYSGSACKLHIGALTTLMSCERHALTDRHAILLKHACSQIAAPSIRRLGTIGGNVLSQVGDSIPSLLVYDSKLVWYTGSGWVEQALEEWLNERRTASSVEQRMLSHVILDCDEVVSEGTEEVRSFIKVGRREAFTPSVVTVALRGRLADDGSFAYIRLTAGGGSSSIMRLQGAERLLLDYPLSGSLLQRVHQAVEAGWPAVNDAFVTGDYRRLVAANVLTAELWKLLKKL